MVTSASSLGRNGVHDFILLRASAVILACYTVFLVGYMAFGDPITYANWHGLFNGTLMKAFTLLALVALLVHAWIGVWQVLTDYIKCVKLRGFLQFIFVIAAMSYLAVGMLTVWGV